MTKFKKINYSSFFTEPRFYLTISCWTREGTKDVSVTNQSTYNTCSEVRESKMPGGSSVRSLTLRSLKATRNRTSQPSLSVGCTELTALLYFICLQESFKRRRVLELCSWFMREAVPPLRSWSRSGLNHGLCCQRVSTRTKTRARNKSNIKLFHINTYIRTQD